MPRWAQYVLPGIALALWLSRFFIRDDGVGVVNGLVVFLIVWWLVFFMMLPIGVRSQEEAGDIVAGTEPGAPMAPDLLKKKLSNCGMVAVDLNWAEQPKKPVVGARLLFDTELVD